MFRLKFAVFAAALCAMFVSSVQAQQAGRPITIIVGTSPGTGPDIVARTVAQELQKKLDQPVVVENRPGASGTIATRMVAAAPDGHTLLVIVDPPFTANVSLLKSVPYDPLKSFVPRRQGRRHSGAVTATA
jgi:tripartite-type tricarboxylate transporter receptor subunit TctC